MDRDFPRDWMWSEAFAMLAKADRLHRELFRPVGSASRQPGWEPPVDILETPGEVLVFIALPGVDIEQVKASIEDGHLVVVGERVLPPELRTAVIHRLELPQGYFVRRVRLPGGRYKDVRRAASNGCLLIALDKVGASHG
jgi:HSP20 family molecular chaperone IbpA